MTLLARNVLKLVLALATLSSSALAEVPSTVKASLAENDILQISLNTGGVPGMGSESTFTDINGNRTYRNISRAAIMPFMPSPGKATGAAVLVLPGGGFAMLSMENEGWPIARWFADRGVAAFVVKYRLNPTPLRESDFQAEMAAVISDIRNGVSRPELLTPSRAVEDGIVALRYVRSNSVKYGIDRARIGMVGFSAGAMTTLAVVEKLPAADQPTFIASIYGPMKAIAVPAAAPAMFVALAADDPIFGRQGFGIVEAWEKSGNPVELHLYQKGGHGFGAGDPALTTGDWRQSLLNWMNMNGFLNPGTPTHDGVAPAGRGVSAQQ